MKWFCKHSWSVQARTVAKPRPNYKIEGRGIEVLREVSRANHGFSNVVLTCSKCGAIETRELLGEVVEVPPGWGKSRRDK